MKSPMIAANPDLLPSETETPGARNRYSELQVLRSGAGWYIGTLYEELDADGNVVWQEPGSRDSDYFATEAKAAASLKLLTALGDDVAASVLREHP